MQTSFVIFSLGFIPSTGQPASRGFRPLLIKCGRAGRIPPTKLGALFWRSIRCRYHSCNVLKKRLPKFITRVAKKIFVSAAELDQMQGSPVRKFTISFLASGALFAAQPAMATVTLTPINGPNLATQIHASATNAANNTTTVYGSTASGGSSQNVQFTANANVHITDGAGFASISDAGGLADFRTLIINPDQDFTALQFSVELVDAGYVYVQYMLSSGVGGWLAPTGTDPFSQAAKTNKDYQITATGSERLGSIRITTCTALASCVASAGIGSGTGMFLEKQNSITLASAVPEPSTWGMMLLGFGAVGASIRRRRKRLGGELRFMRVASNI